jgi:hypothetical protein
MKGYVMVVFRLPLEHRIDAETILEGKFSKVNRQTVDRYFPDSQMHPLYGNRLVFYQSPRWRTFWEEKLGVPLPVDAEVYSKPLLKNEIYGYITTAAAIVRQTKPEITID